MHGITHLQITPTLPKIQTFNVTWKQILNIISIIVLILPLIRISIAVNFLLLIKVLLSSDWTVYCSLKLGTHAKVKGLLFLISSLPYHPKKWDF